MVSRVEALCVALATMVAFTAITHFVPWTRVDLLAMVPPALPTPGVLLSVTGVIDDILAARPGAV